MKRFLLLLYLLPGMLCVHGQDMISKKRNNFVVADKCPKAYFGVGTGLNNPNGILGFNVSVPIKFVSVCGGIGVSTWGNKIFAEGRYYLRPCQRGFAFGAGITHNTGRDHAMLKMQTDQGSKQTVTINLYAITNAYIAAYHFWTIGKRHNKFYVDAGYSVPLQTAHFRQVFPPGQQQQSGLLTQSAKDRLRLLSPGGFMVGAGFCFGLR
jgi:hypothetical protein